METVKSSKFVAIIFPDEAKADEERATCIAMAASPFTQKA